MLNEGWDYMMELYMKEFLINQDITPVTPILVYMCHS